MAPLAALHRARRREDRCFPPCASTLHFLMLRGEHQDATGSLPYCHPPQDQLPHQPHCLPLKQGIYIVPSLLTSALSKFLASRFMAYRTQYWTQSWSFAQLVFCLLHCLAPQALLDQLPDGKGPSESPCIFSYLPALEDFSHIALSSVLTPSLSCLPHSCNAQVWKTSLGSGAGHLTPSNSPSSVKLTSGKSVLKRPG